LRATILFLLPLLTLLIYLLIFITTLLFIVDINSLTYVLQHDRFIRALRVSIIAAFGSATLTTLLCTPIAYALSRRIIPGGSIANVMGLAVLSLPPVAIGLMLLGLFKATPHGSLIDYRLQIVYDIKGIVLAQMTVELPVVLVLLKQVFDYINPEPEDTLMTMGATRAQAMLKATIPEAIPGIVAAYIVAWLRSLGEFGATLVVSGNIHYKTETLPLLMYNYMSEAKLAEGLIVVVIILTIAVLSATLIYLYYKPLR